MVPARSAADRFRDLVGRFGVLFLAALIVIGIAFGAPISDFGEYSAAAQLTTIVTIPVVLLAAAIVGRVRSRLDRSETRLRTLVSQLPVIPYVDALDSSSSAIEVSPKVESLLGYSPAHWTADREFFPKILHPDDRERVLAEHEQTRATGRPIDTTYRLVAKDGDVVWVHDYGTIIRSGKRATLQGFLVDVTNFHTALDALMQSEERYRLIIETAEEGVWMLDENDRTTFVNRKLADLLGFDRGDIVGRHVTDFVDPADHGPLEKRLAERRRGMKDQHESVLVAKDGRKVNILVSSSALFADGNYTGSLAMISDISDRKRVEAAQRELAAIVESSTDAIFHTSCDGTIRSWNVGAQRMFGYASEEVVGQSVTLLAPPDRVDEVLDNIRRVEAGETVSGLEAVRVRKDGTRLDVSLTLSPLRNEGEFYGISAIVRETTEQKQLAEQLRQAQKLEAIGQLAGGVAHDFNNSLMAIRGYAELMLTKMKAEDPLRRHAEGVRSAADGAASVTRQLLAFGRKQMLQPRVVDPNETLGEMQAMLRRLIGEHIELEFRAGSTGHLHADPGQLEQIVLNLAVNARDAMPKGGLLRIETADLDAPAPLLRTSYEVPAGRYLALMVSDTGEGIPPEVKEKMFEPFFTTKKHVPASGSGTGLGLATVYGVVKQSGGFIDVTTDVGKGTTFEILFPRHDPPESATVAAPAVEAASGSEAVLLVEDEAPVRELLRAMLEEQGYEVITAANGADAVLALKDDAARVDVLVTDVVMPGMSGPELAMRVVRLRPGTKLLYMSGYTDETVLDHGALNANVPFLQKPFSGDELGRKVREVLDGRGSAKTLSKELV